MERRLPVWVLGLANLPLGITGAVALLITPQVLAARHAAETTIANITTMGLASTMVFFLVAPVLDVRFSRRTYAIAMSVAACVLTVVAVLNFSNVELLVARVTGLRVLVVVGDRRLVRIGPSERI